jgi:hypothetical protein
MPELSGSTEPGPAGEPANWVYPLTVEPPRWVQLFPGGLAASGPEVVKFTAALPVEPGQQWWAPIASAGPEQNEEDPMNPVQALRLIAGSVASGRISPAGAHSWAARYADGEPIAVLAQLEPAGPPLAGAALSQVTNECASILGVAAGPPGWPDWEAAEAAEADGVFPPRAVAAAGKPTPPPSPSWNWDQIFSQYAGDQGLPRYGGHQEQDTTPTVYRGEDQGKRNRDPALSWDGYVSGAAGDGDLDEAACYEALFGGGDGDGTW